MVAMAPGRLVEQASLQFEGFFSSEYEHLFRTMWLMTGNKAEGEDLAQEAMARAYERWDRIQRATNPAAYVYQIAFNLKRRRVRRMRLEGAMRVRDSEGPDPADQAGARVDLMRAVANLPRHQQETLLLVTWVGMTPEEAGRLLRIRPATVRVRLHRARETLKLALGGAW